MHTWVRGLWLVAAIAGTAVLFCGTALAVLLAVATVTTAEGTIAATQALLAAGILGVSVIWGGALVLHGWSGWRARPSRPFRIRYGGWLLTSTALSIGAGAVVAALPAGPLLLPPLHVLSMTLMAFGVIWLGARGLNGRAGSWRQFWGSMAAGGLLSAIATILLEGLTLLMFSLAAAAVLLAVSGPDYLRTLVEQLQNADWLENPHALAPWLLSPGVVLSVLFAVAVLVPLIEEALKTLVVGIIGIWVRPSPAFAFLWGLASGVGFALTENLLNGTLGGIEGWAPVALSRFGASLMHGVTGAIMGWGWGQLWTNRPFRPQRIWRLLGCYAAAVAIHSLWNALAIGVTFLALAIPSANTNLVKTVLGAADVCLGSILVLLVLALGIVLVLCGHSIGRRTRLEEAPFPALTEAE